MADGSVAYGSVPFKQQIAFFRAKTNVPTERWTDLWQEEHDHAFMVAGANRIDLLADLRQAVDRAIADGGSLDQFRQDFDQVVAKYGWDYTGGRDWRTRVIYETNLRTSYAAGRYAQLQDLKKVRPFWRYRHSDSVQHPRPQHLAWNNLVLPADDPWWNTHFPPNGWGCQCTVEALNARDLERMGKDGPDDAPPDDMQEVIVGQRGPAPITVETPDGVDPGFGYAPGQSAFEQLAQNLLTKAARLPAAPAASALDPVLARPGVQRALADGYRSFQADVLRAGQPRNATLPIGALDADLVKAMTAHDAVPATATIVAKDTDVLRALRPQSSDASHSHTATLSTDTLAELPTLLAGPRAVLLDKESGVLLYVSGGADRGDGGQVMVAIRYPATTSRQVLNTFQAGAWTNLADVRAAVTAGRLFLLRGSLD